jgi:putative hemolysin
MRHERLLSSSRFTFRLARTREEIRAAQRLRWTVFSQEQGAQLHTPEPGLDIDDLDPYCEHLIVTDAASDAVIGTYRLLTADAARRAGGYYSEREFNMDAVLRSDRKLLEIGRSCVLPEYRSGAAIALLWSGIAGYITQSGHDALIGCASIPLQANAVDGAALARSLADTHAAPEELKVTPRNPLPFVATGSTTSVPLPPLVKGYLRSGAIVCGAPCWDPEFNCADLFLFLDLSWLTGRYARRFMSAGAKQEPAQICA